MFIAQILLFIGCALLYLSHPNQQWRHSPLPPLARLASALCLLVALACLLGHYSLATSVLISIGSAMAYLGAMPFCVVARTVAAHTPAQTTQQQTAAKTDQHTQQQKPPQAARDTVPLRRAGKNQQGSRTMTAPTHRLVADWPFKTSAILFFSYPLALALSGLLFWLLPDLESREQLWMWTVVAITLLLVALGFLIRTGRRAWWALSLATASSWALLKASQMSLEWLQ